MKNLVTICAAVVLLVVVSVQAAMLDDFEDGVQNWANAGGTSSTLANVNTEAYSGSRSLKMGDNAAGYVNIDSQENHGDLSSLKGTYVEFAVKGTALSNGIARSDALQFYIGSSVSDRSCWRVSESNFQSIAPYANGWWKIHLELNSDGTSTINGATMNDVPVTADSYTSAWQSGSNDWTSIKWIQLLLPQGSGGDVGTYYFDQLAIGQPVPEPATVGLLVLGLSFLRRK